MDEIKTEEINSINGEPVVTEKPEEQTFSKFLNSLSDLLLEHNDFNYNIVRSAAERVNDNFDIDNYLDLDEITNHVQEHLDMYDLANNLEDYLDYDDIARKTIREMDMSEVASNVNEYIDIEYQIDHRAENLLNDYNPSSGCAIGLEFTKAIARALQYMTENSENEDFEVIQFLMNRNAIVVERTVDSDRNLVAETVVKDNDDNLTSSETFVPSEVPANNIQEHCVEAMKRVVHEVLASYIPNIATDPFMKIRLEAKAFDTFNLYMDGKW